MVKPSNRIRIAQSEPKIKFNPEIGEGDLNTAQEDSPKKDLKALRWVAPEFIYHPKNLIWYLLAVFATLALAVAAYFFGRGDWIPSVFIVLGGVIFIVFAARKPRKINYQIDNKSLVIGSQRHSLNSFAYYYLDLALQDRVEITLIENKRFGLPISLNFKNPKLASRVLDIIAGKVPEAAAPNNLAERIAKKVRF